MNGQRTPLSELLTAGRDRDLVVAFDSTGDRRWDELSQAVWALSRRLASAAACRWLLYFEDSYEFAVALLAVAHSGGVAVLPPNAQPGTLARLASEVDGYLVSPETPLSAPALDTIRSPFEPGCRTDTDFGRLDPETPLAEFFTSGTSGDNKRIRKRIRHLDDEVAVLEDTFGESMGRSAIVATVSHQHIYGTLFRVLWPLTSARAFSARTFLHGSEIVARLSDGPTSLVSSPVQLKAMADSTALDAVVPVAVFSSGAPLDETTAVAVASATGTAVSEVFGSTETGGVAWRRRPRGGDVPWRSFPGVAIDRDSDGRLTVTSRLVSVGEDVGDGRARYTMGDRVEIADDGRFSLRGRADRLVKIGSKRLSLPDMEAELNRSPSVEESALVVIRRGLESRVCAALVLSEDGRADLAATSRGEMGRRLAGGLAPYFDRVLLPRAWRFVDRLPRTAQGKLPDAAVGKLFESDPAPRDPVIVAERVERQAIQYSCSVPDDLAFFDGHFDSFAVVPGVAQLRWVIAAARTLTGEEPEIAAIEALKFRKPLLPGSHFELEVVADMERKRIRFRLWGDEGEHTTGRIALT